MIINFSGSVPASVKKSRLEHAVCRVFDVTGRAKHGAVSISFVTEAKMRALNRQYRKKDRATDVLSFAATDVVKKKIKGAAEKDWGDIILAPSYIKRQAKENKVPFNEELVRLTAHGMLHLLGFDHATVKDRKKMFGWQESVVQKIVC
jgi:probable rRNA maturation factor